MKVGITALPMPLYSFAFLQRFGNSPAKSALARAELAAFRQGVLSVDAFADEVERRSSDIKDITLKEKQFFFLNGLNPYYLQHVTLGQETFEGMRQQAREAELKNRMSVNATVVQPSAVPPVASTATPFIPVTAASVATPVAAPNQTPRVTTMQTQDVDTNMDTSVATLRKHEYYDSGVDRQEALVPKRPRLFHPRPPPQFDQDQRNNDRRRGLCYICHQPNHLQRNCPHNTAARHPRPYYYPRPPVYPMVNSLTGYTPTLIYQPPYPTWPSVGQAVYNPLMPNPLPPPVPLTQVVPQPHFLAQASTNPGVPGSIIP
jgi:hypothetical protein